VTTTRDQALGDEPSGRRSPGRPRLPLDRIVATALAITDEEGVEALSMRTLAQRLNSGTATLYRHFDNRAALVAHVVDRVFGEVELDAGQLAAMGWQAACRAVAHGMFDALGQHKNVALLLTEEVPLGPNAMVLRERCLQVLLDGGFAPQVAARSYAALAGHVLGFAMQLGGHGGAGRDADARVSAAFHATDPARFPATAAVADSLPVPLREEFSFGLDLLLRGLSQLRDLEPGKALASER
jgi:AcrR family transcriptional regulator